MPWQTVIQSKFLFIVLNPAGLVKVQVGCGANIGLWKLISVSKVTLWRNAWLKLPHWLYKQVFTFFFIFLISFLLLCLYVNAHTLALYCFIFEFLVKLAMMSHNVPHLLVSAGWEGVESLTKFSKRGVAWQDLDF